MKRKISNEIMPSSSSSIKWERTNLRLPVQASDDGAFSSHSERAASTCAEVSANAHLESNDCYYLCLPSCIDSKVAYERSKDYENNDDQLSKTQKWHNRMALDRYLSSVPQLAASKQQLLSSNPNNTHPSNNHHKLITSTNSGRVINVLQGEIAHCTAAQADVLVSDDATTCHILGLWSRLLCGDVAASALATLAHIDSPEYQDCIRNAIELHYQYHASMLSNNNDNTTQPFIELSIHLMGGYNDEKGTSHAITEALLRTLTHECDKYVSMKPGLQMIVQTCAVSSCNDDGSGCPIGRGLALDVSSGQVYLAEVEEDVESFSSSSSSLLENISAAKASLANDAAITMSAKGPDCLLRSARLWASCLFNDSDHKRKLQIIHHINDDYLHISPFFFTSHPFLYQMLALNDDVLLQQCSSSPKVEKDNFARHVRETFRYMIGTNCFHVFQEKARESEREYWDDGDYLPRRYCRVGLNGWTVVR